MAVRNLQGFSDVQKGRWSNVAKFNLHSEFGSQKPHETADAQICARIEALLVDAADGTLDSDSDSEVQRLFDAHLAACTGCSSMLADTRRGAAWLEMLKSHEPEPPRDLVSRILAQTSLAQTSLAQTSLAQSGVQTSVQTSTPAGSVFIGDRPFADQPSFSANLPRGIGTDSWSLQDASLATGSKHPVPGSAPRSSSNVLPFRARIAAGLRPWKHTFLQPRLAMTAAMAFFSVALTLDVTGIHLNQLRASELRPSSLKRSFYAANAHVARYYDNLRVVYELESRVRDLQRSSADDAPREQTPAQPTSTQPDSRPENNLQNKQQPSNPQKDQSHPAPNPGTSRRDEAAPKGNSAGQKTYHPSQHPGDLALATLPFPLRVPFVAHNLPSAPGRIAGRLAGHIATSPAPKERGDLA